MLNIIYVLMQTMLKSSLLQSIIKLENNKKLTKGSVNNECL